MTDATAQNLIEVEGGHRAIQLDMDDKWYGWIFRREGTNWVRERYAADWERYDASVQSLMIKGHGGRTQQQMARSQLRRLRKRFKRLSTRRPRAIDASTSRSVVTIVDELRYHQARLRVQNGDDLKRLAVQLASLLDIPLWMTSPKAFISYIRRADQDADGMVRRGDTQLDTATVVQARRLQIASSAGGTIAVSVDGSGAAFFNKYHMTESPQTYRALCVLCEAIRRDNESRPQT